MNLLAKFGAACVTILGVFANYSCDSIFHDDLSDCPQGVYVRFYQQTPCYNYKNTSVGKVNNLHVLAFDKQTGLLANFVAADQEMMLTTEHETLLPLQQGDYELVAWTGNAAELASAKLQKGVTHKSDVFFQLRQQQDGSYVFPNTPEPLRYGFAGTGLNRLPLDSAEYAHREATSQYPLDEVINIPDPAKEGSVFRHAAINLRPQTLRVNVQLVVDGSVKSAKYPTAANNFDLQLLTSGRALAHEAAKNGSALVDWAVPQAKLVPATDARLLQPLQKQVVADTLKQSYNLLGNTANNLAEGRLVIMHKGKKVELSDAVKQLTSALDLPALIRIALEKQNINLNCGDEVTIKLHVKNQCVDCDTYMIFDVEIEKWSVHSYETELAI